MPSACIFRLLTLSPSLSDPPFSLFFLLGVGVVVGFWAESPPLLFFPALAQGGHPPFPRTPPVVFVPSSSATSWPFQFGSSLPFFFQVKVAGCY